MEELVLLKADSFSLVFENEQKWSLPNELYKTNRNYL